MAITQDKCVSCSSRARSYDLQTTPELFLKADGTFLGLPYWFCSVECYKKAVRKHLDARYDIDKKAEDDDEYDETFKKARREYADETSGGILLNLFTTYTYKSEMDCIHTHMNAFVESFRLRQIDEIEAAEIELHRRLYAEWEHQIDQENAASEKEAAKRDAQDAKLAQEQEARNAEEEKWRPKPFDL